MVDRALASCASGELRAARRAPRGTGGSALLKDRSLDEEGHQAGIHLLRNAVTLRAPGRRPRKRRHVRFLAGLAVAFLLVIGGLVTGGIMLRSADGPVSVTGLNARVAEALRAQIGQGWQVSVADASLSWRGLGPGLDVKGVTIRNPEGQVVLQAPDGAVEVDPLNLAVGQFRPTSITLAGLDLKLVAGADGSLATGRGQAAAAPVDAGEAQGGATAGSLIALVNQTEALFGELTFAELRDARLIVVGADDRERVALRNVRIAIGRAGATGRVIDVNVEGDAGPWSLTAEIGGVPGAAREIRVGFTDMVLVDLWLLAGQTVVPVDPGSALSGELRATFAASGEMQTLTGAARARGGRLGLAMGEVDHLPLDQVTFVLNRGTEGFTLDSLRYVGGGSDVGLSGTVRPGDGGGWQVALTGDGSVLSGADASDPPVRLDSARLEATIAPPGGEEAGRLSMAVATGGSRAEMAMAFPQRPDGLAARLDLRTTPVDVRTALRLWPAFAATGTRQYLIDTLTRGRAEDLAIRIDLPPHILRTFFKEQPWPDDSVNVRFAIADAEFRPAPGLPPLVDARFDGVVTATTARLGMPGAMVAMADGRRLALTEGVMSSDNTTGKRPLATASMRLAGKADALMALLASEALKPVINSDIDPASVSGEADLRATLGIKLGAALDAREVDAKVRGSFANTTMENAFGAERLEGANLTFAFADKALQMRGEGKLLGLPATIEVKPGAAGQPSIGTVSLVLDEAARKRRGLSAGRKLTGPVAIKATAPVGVAGARARIEADLTRAAVDDLIPGWDKPAGRPARLSFSLGSRPGSVLLDEIALESPTLTAKGHAELKPDLTPVKAEFETVRLSPGDNVAVRVTRDGAVTRVAVSGSVLDARPFIRRMQAPPPAATRGRTDDGDGADIDLEVSVPIVTGFNDEAITQAQLSVSQRGRDVRDLRFSGRIGSAPIRLDLQREGTRVPMLVLQAQDAGALLRYTDLYRRMLGGQMMVRLTAFEPVQTGDITIRDFGLRDEPALGRIMASQPFSTGNDDRATAMSGRRVDTNVVGFTTLRGEFTRSASRLDLRDAVMWGGLVGLNIAGSIDYGRDRVDLDGTYVPAYGLNNAFAQVPLFGPLLGGGATEGLFAVSFRISGAASAPTLTVNPLSFVAPGIFRKFVDAFRLDPTTGSTAPAPPVR